MKKILLILGTVASIALPISTVVACSSTNEDITNKINGQVVTVPTGKTVEVHNVDFEIGFPLATHSQPNVGDKIHMFGEKSHSSEEVGVKYDFSFIWTQANHDAIDVIVSADVHGLTLHDWQDKIGEVLFKIPEVVAADL